MNVANNEAAAGQDRDAAKPKKQSRSNGVEHIIRASNGRYLKLRLTRKEAIAAKCTECLGFEDNPISCTSPCCPLFPFRTKTFRTRRGTIDYADLDAAQRALHGENWPGGQASEPPPAQQKGTRT